MIRRQYACSSRSHPPLYGLLSETMPVLGADNKDTRSNLYRAHIRRAQRNCFQTLSTQDSSLANEEYAHERTSDSMQLAVCLHLGPVEYLLALMSSEPASAACHQVYSPMRT